MGLLRASSEVAGHAVELRAVVDPSRMVDSGVAGGGALLALADAMVAGEEETLEQARCRVMAELGPMQRDQSIHSRSEHTGP